MTGLQAVPKDRQIDFLLLATVLVAKFEQPAQIAYALCEEVADALYVHNEPKAEVEALFHLVADSVPFEKAVMSLLQHIEAQPSPKEGVRVLLRAGLRAEPLRPVIALGLNGSPPAAMTTEEARVLVTQIGEAIEKAQEGYAERMGTPYETTAETVIIDIDNVKGDNL